MKGFSWACTQRAFCIKKSFQNHPKGFDIRKGPCYLEITFPVTPQGDSILTPIRSQRSMESGFLFFRAGFLPALFLSHFQKCASRILRPSSSPIQRVPWPCTAGRPFDPRLCETDTWDKPRRKTDRVRSFSHMLDDPADVRPVPFRIPGRGQEPLELKLFCDRSRSHAGLG